MRILLDTQIFIFLSEEGIGSVSPRIRKLVEDLDNELLLSSVSISEIAIKAGIKKLSITERDASRAAEDLRLTLIPFEPRHAMRIFELPLHHRDPFDRMLIATALSEAVPIITEDAAFKAYRGLKVVS